MILDRFADHKVHVVLGPRQAGKTTLARSIEVEAAMETIWFNGDETSIQQLLAAPDSTRLRALIGSARLVIFDEAQRIENIGLTLKLLHDNFPELKILATGSSAFELANRINEPLTGRKWEYLMLPLSFQELVGAHGLLRERQSLHHRLTYGSYPEVISSPGREVAVLKQLVDSYLYKDIFTWERIQKPDRLVKLLTALAHQIGNEVSYAELSQLTQLDFKTVEKYLDLLEKTYTIFRLYAYSRNVRTELKKSRKIYFCDLGVRNTLLNNFSDPALRDDTGHLWENYLVLERLKWSQAAEHFSNRWFWRTTQQQEIDYIEEYAGTLHAFEFKWSPTRKARFSKTFLSAYPVAETRIITPENYDEFISSQPVP